MDEIFSKNYPLVISNVRVDGRDTDIFIDDTGMIAATGPDVRKQYAGEAEFIIDGDRAIALPGLVNTHTHAAMTLLRGYADDMFLQDWLSQKIWPLEAHLTGDDVYWGTKLACLEMIKTGTTAFNDMYFFMEDTARAVLEMGIRAMLCHGFIDLGNPQKREDECRATEKLVSHIRSPEQPPDPCCRRPPRTLHRVKGRIALVRGICTRAEDRDPHPCVRDGKGGT